MRPDLDQFLTFVKVVQTGSFTRAARDLSLTQPAVSAQMRRLEAQLGARLFDRLGRQLQLTEAGRALYRYAERVEDLAAILEAAADEVDASRGELRGRVALGGSTTPGIFVLPRVLERFRREHPPVQLALEVGTTAALLEALRANLVDFALLEGIVSGRDLVVEPVYDASVALIVGRGHPWYGQDGPAVDPAELASQPAISYQPGSGMQAAIDEGRRGRAGPRPRLGGAGRRALAAAAIRAGVASRQAPRARRREAARGCPGRPGRPAHSDRRPVVGAAGTPLGHARTGR